MDAAETVPRPLPMPAPLALAAAAAPAAAGTSRPSLADEVRGSALLFGLTIAATAVPVGLAAGLLRLAGGG